jgi:uncharacterized protein with FMN-binding domain
MAQGGSNKKVANSLVAVSCGAVLAVYTAGYVRTQAAVDRFEAQAAERRREVLGPPPSTYILPRFQPPAPPGGFEREHSHAARKHEEHATILADVPAAAAQPSPAEIQALPSPVESVTAIVAAPAPSPAPEPVAPAPAATVPAAPMWKDGSYLGWGTSRHGNIQAEVVVEGGRIASATIAQCRTRYSCSVIDRLPPQVAQRQSPDVDYVSGATQSADAFYFAVVDALSKAK